MKHFLIIVIALIALANTPQGKAFTHTLEESRQNMAEMGQQMRWMKSQGGLSGMIRDR